MEMRIYQEILENHFKILMTQSKHSLIMGLAGCAAKRCGARLPPDAACPIETQAQPRDAGEAPKWHLRRPLFL